MKLPGIIILVLLNPINLPAQETCIQENKSLKVVSFELQPIGNSLSSNFSLFKVLKSDLCFPPYYLCYSGNTSPLKTKSIKTKGILRKVEIPESHFSCWGGNNKITVYYLTPLDFKFATLKSKNNYYADCSSFQPEKMD